MINLDEIFIRVSEVKFEDRPVESDKITQLLRAAMTAPSVGNRQPWEFRVVTDKEKIEGLSEIYPNAPCVKNAPVVIVPCYRTAEVRWEDTLILDLASATENILLETGSLELSSVWLCAAPFYDKMEKVDTVLGISKELHVFVLVPVGYTAKDRAQTDRFD